MNLLLNQGILSVHPYEVRTGIMIIRQHLNIPELHVAGVAYEEAFGGQVAPHRCLRIFLRLLVVQRLVNLRQVTHSNAALVVQADVRQPNVLHRVVGEACDAAAYGAGIAYLDVVDTHAIDAAYVVNGNQFADGVVVALAA